MPTLWDMLMAPEALRAEQAVTEGPATWRGTRAELHAEAQQVASGLVQRGVGPGDLVACLLTNSRASMAGLLGVWWAGAAVASVPSLARGMSLDAYRQQLNAICSTGDMRFLLVERRVAGLLLGTGTLVSAELLTLEELLSGTSRLSPRPLEAHETAFLQFSSGTTSRPRGVALSSDAIAAQLAMLSERAEVDSERDSVSSWLPLSHDMGLFSWLMCWTSAVKSHINPPERFLASPRTWLDDCAEYGATVTLCPPLALRLAARTSGLSRVRKPLLLRCVVVGGDRVDAAPIADAALTLSARGLRAEAITPAYGLAEATLAVTMADLDRPAKALGRAESQALGDSAFGSQLPAVLSSGRPLRGVQVRIDSAEGSGIGEICVRSPSLASAYANDPIASAQVFSDGECRTGDLGVIVAGDLYVLGRLDDVLIIGGRNFHASHIEDILATHDGVRPGACAYVDLPMGQERPTLVFVAELSSEPRNPDELGRALAREAMHQAGLPLDECLFLPQGAFPRTPSGKAQRFLARKLASTPPPEAVHVRLRKRPGQLAER